MLEERARLVERSDHERGDRRGRAEGCPQLAALAIVGVRACDLAALAIHDRVLAGVRLQIRDDIGAGKLEGGPEREEERAQDAETEGRGKQRGAGARRPDDVERHQVAERGDEEIRGPDGEEQPGGTTDEGRAPVWHCTQATRAWREPWSSDAFTCIEIVRSPRVAVRPVSPWQRRHSRSAIPWA